jgi:hypothetical protein
MASRSLPKPLVEPHRAVDKLRRDRPQNEGLAVALDGQLGTDRKFHLFADLGRDDDLAFGAQSAVYSAFIRTWREL